MGEERKSVEFTGKTVDQAIEEGLATLGIGRHEAEIKVLSEGSRGILGIGAEDARVLITWVESTRLVKPTRPIEQPEEQKAEQPPAIPSDLAEVTKGIVEDLLARMNISADVTIRPPNDASLVDSPPLVIDITGDDLGILIGRRGDTLAAFQFVTRLIVSRKIHRWVNLVVDVERYKQRREKRLVELAHRTAERVLREGRAFSLQAMPAHERRIIHLALRDHPDIVTMSVGRGDRRKVTLRPRK